MTVIIHGARVCRHGRILSYDLTSDMTDKLPEIEGCTECSDYQIGSNSTYLTAEQLEQRP